MIRFWSIVPAMAPHRTLSVGWGTLLLALCIGTGCAPSMKTRLNAEAAAKEKQDTAARAMIEQIDRNTAAIRDGQNEVAALGTRMKALEARVDSLSSSGVSTLSELRENVSFLTTQVQRLDSSLREPAPVVQTQAKKPAKVFKPEGYNVESAYREAFAAYRAKKYDTAIGAFTEIMTVAPSSSLADNAQYWIGECYYSMRNYEKALQAFTRVFTFPNTNKAADAHLKIAMIYQLMDNTNAAREELNLVVKQYPATEAAKIASAKLESLGK